MSDPEISVVIPFFNASAFLSRAINSLFRQRHCGVREIIIVDDASTPLEAENLKVIISNFHNSLGISLKVITNDVNLGPAYSRNIGIYNSTSEWVSFLDSDDEWGCNRVKSVAKVLALKRFDAVYTGYVLRRRGRRDKEFHFYYGRLLSRRQTSLIGHAFGIPGGSPMFFFKREMLLNGYLFDSRLRFNEDFDLLMRLLGDEKRVIGLNDNSYIVHKVDNSHSSTFNEAHLHDIEMYLSKNLTLGNVGLSEFQERMKTACLAAGVNAFKKGDLLCAERCFARAFTYQGPRGLKQHLVSFWCRYIKCFR